MRKLIVSLFTAAALLAGFSAVQAQAGCQNIDVQNRLGAFAGTVCFDGTTLTLDGAAVVAATGKTYTVDADATVSGSAGNYTVSGTVTLSDGTTTKTITFSSSGMTATMAATMFVGKTINYTLSQTPPPPMPHFPPRMHSTSTIN